MLLRPPRRLAVLPALLLMVTLLAVVNATSTATAVEDPSAGVLDVEGELPTSLGSPDLAALRYGDPGENVSALDSPEPNPDGTARTSMPLIVPEGRAGMQPELTLGYDSGGGNSWLGVGWDLTLPAVTVDTAFGAPRFHPDLETEIYALDGARLVPTSIRPAGHYGDRVTDRSDFVRQVEGEFERIIRYGDEPGHYWWRVTDKDGTDRWYGGTPDGRDGTSILTTAGGAGFHWALTYVEDISGNTMTYDYRKLSEVKIGGTEDGSPGVALYPRTIDYAGFDVAGVGDDSTAVDAPPYRVEFLTKTGRPDVVVDARGGAPVVHAELLDRIKISYRPPEDGSTPRLVGGYQFGYADDAPFEKSLLTTIGQFGADGAVFAEHRLDWFDDVRGEAGYDGFADEIQWDDGGDDPDLASISATSALSTAQRAGGDGGSYIGFNPVAPQKTLSIGGSFRISGGGGEVKSRMMDIDGDSLPDKVFIVDKTPYWQRNMATPADESDAGSKFASKEEITGVDELGLTRDFRVDLGIEAYPIASVQVGGGFGFSFVDRYFQDVNADGRPDFVQSAAGGGQVFFNELTDDGDVRFVQSSASTAVPLEGFEASDRPDSATGALVDAAQPRIDTVRRWVAPFDGTVEVTGEAALVDGAEYGGDGAQVSLATAAADNSGNQRRTATVLDADTPSAPVEDTVAVSRGDQLFFRVHTLDDVTGDEVRWSPVVTYTGTAGATDANGRDQLRYALDEDFTVFGRTGGRTALLDGGPATLALDLERTGDLSDDVEAVVRLGTYDGDSATITELDPVELPDSDALRGLAAGRADATPTSQPLTYEFDVTQPARATADQPAEKPDFLEVEIVSDTPVDPNSFGLSLDLQTSASTPTPEEPPVDVPVPDAEPPIVIPSARVFSVSDGTAPYVPFVAGSDGDHTVAVRLHGDKLAEPDSDGIDQLASDAVLSVKGEQDGVVQVLAREEFRVRHAHDSDEENFALRGAASLDFTADADATYWLEVSVHRPGIAAEVAVASETITGPAGDAAAETVDIRKHAPDVQGTFASGNRGWTVAGYNADHEDANGAGPLVAEQFELEVAGGEAGVELDEDFDVAAASESLSVDQLENADGSLDVGGGFPASLAYVPWGEDGGPADRWRAAESEALFATAGSARSSRLGSPLDPPAPTGAESDRPAIGLISSEGDFSIALGLGPAQVSGALGAGEDMTGFEDLNGDGFPDIRDGTAVEVTGPRGDNVTETEIPANGPTSLTASVGGGIGGSAVNAQVTKAGGASTKNRPGMAPTSENKKRGVNIGLSAGVQGAWTNPLSPDTVRAHDGADDDSLDEILTDLDDGADGAPKERALADINGDGIVDIIDSSSADAMKVQLGTGYGYAAAVTWGQGTFNSAEVVGGNLGVGFQVVNYEFGGGAGGSEAATTAAMQWADLDGDGVPDQLTQVDNDGPTLRFGTGAFGEAGDPLTYGTFPHGSVDFVGNDTSLEEAIGPRASFARSTSVTGGADFSVYIGPICVVACYIVINPGAHGGVDRSTTEIDLEDMNGDGYLDVVHSKHSNDVRVSLNTGRRTNLLRSVQTPLGARYDLDYERQGPTRTQPESLWVMSDLTVDDGRPGDGEDAIEYRYEYAGNAYDRLLRQMLGFSEVTEEQYTPADEDADAELERTVVRHYRNATPFDSGVLVREELLDSAGVVREYSAKSHDLVQVAGPDVVLASPEVELGKPGRVDLFDAAFAPLVVEDTFLRYDADRDELSSRVTFAYDERGNVVRQVDHHQRGTTDDDTVTDYTYPAECGQERSRAGAEPDADGQRDTWVQVPAEVTVANADGDVLRHRDGSLDLCLNAIPIRIVADQGPDRCGDPAYAVTELSLGDYGSYNGMIGPSHTERESCDDPAQEPPSGDQQFFGCTPGSGTSEEFLDRAAEDERQCHDYVRDPHRFTDVASVTDAFGVTSTATFDPITGRPSSETDANGNTVVVCYDDQGRVSTVAAPRELTAAGLDPTAPAAACDRLSAAEGPETPTVRYAYSLNPGATRSADGHAWATAEHRDVTADGDPIETAAFVDGLGRVVQRKRDADVDVEYRRGPDTTETLDVPVRVVEGAVDYDALGREVRQWFPVLELHRRPDGPTDTEAPLFGLTDYNTLTSSASGPNTSFVPTTEPTRVKYDIFDRTTLITAPDGTTHSTAHDIAAEPASGLMVAAPTTTDPLKRKTRTFRDVRGVTLRVVETPAPGSDDAKVELGALAEGDRGPARIQPAAESHAEPITTTAAYDALARLTRVTGTDEAVTTHRYDMLDNRVETTGPDAGTVQRRWSPAGTVVAEADQVRLDRGTETRYVYDRDRLVEIDYPDSAPTGGEVTPDAGYTFGGPDDADINAAGRVTEVVDGAMTRHYEYDVDGNVAVERGRRAADPWGKGPDTDLPTYVTEFGYDSLQRLLAVTYPDGERLTHGFDRGGAVDRIGSRMPQPPVQTEAGTVEARADREFTYLAQVDYDEFGAVARTVTGTGVETTYQRDRDRRWVTGVDTDARPTEQYDGTTSEATQLQRLRYQYDDVGNTLAGANLLYGTRDAGADFGDGARTLRAGDAIAANGLPGPSQHEYGYDGHYRLTGASSKYVDRTEDRTLSYASDYAPNGTLLAKTQAAHTFGTTGNGTGNGNGNGNGGNGGGGGGNGGGNAKKNTDPTISDETTPLSQCDTGQPSGGGVDNQDPTLTYTLAAEDVEYDAAHPHRLTLAGNRSYRHDANGSLTRWQEPCASGKNDEVRQLTWDAANRLVRIAQGSLKSDDSVTENATTHYRYNAEGARTLERRPSEIFFVNRYWRVEGGDRQYASVYLGDDRIALHRTTAEPELPGAASECDPAVETCDPCDPTTHRCASDEVADGACADPEVMVDEENDTCEPLHREVVRFLHPDATGSMRVATDAVGRVFQYIDYTANGRPWVAGQSMIKDTPYLFAGGWTDTQFGLTNFGARWYDPREEQFYSVEPMLTEDPLAVLSDRTMLSSYSYARSNPLRYVDEDGYASRGQALWDSTTGFNPKLTTAQKALVQELPATTISPKSSTSRLVRGRTGPAGGGPFTNDLATLEFLSGDRKFTNPVAKAAYAVLKGASKVDDFSLLTIRVKPSGTQLRPFSKKRR